MVTDKELNNLRRNLEKSHEGFITLEFIILDDREYIVARASMELLADIVNLTESEPRGSVEAIQDLARLKASCVALHTALEDYEEEHWETLKETVAYRVGKCPVNNSQATQVAISNAEGRIVGHVAF